MKKKAVTRMLASILAGVLASTALTGCTFGFASDPDDPNEVNEKGLLILLQILFSMIPVLMERTLHF